MFLFFLLTVPSFCVNCVFFLFGAVCVLWKAEQIRKSSRRLNLKLRKAEQTPASNVKP